MGSKSFVFRFADVEVREREFTLIKAGKALTVEPKAFRALLFLLHNPQRLISKEELLNSLWGDAAVTEGSLTRCIWLLRRLLEDDIHQPRYIETVATVGYRFVCPVEVLDDGGYGSEPAHVSAEIADEVIQAKPRSLRRWWLVAASILAVGLSCLIWYLRRPLPPPRISGYAQITHDGLGKEPIATDGSRLYFNQATPAPIAQVGIAGGEIVPIPVPVPYLTGLDDVSPDGSNFLVESMDEGSQSNKLWNLRIPRGPLRRLGEDLYAAYSSDGKSVIYSTEGGDIYVVRSDGTETHKLASIGPIVSNPVWSPDGDIVRFYKDSKLWQMSSRGSNLHRLLSGWHPWDFQCCGRWTPDGKFFLFLSGYPGVRGNQIWALDERRELFRKPPADPIQLTTGPLNWSSPIPGKDGKTIFAAGISARGELSRFDAKSKQFQPFLGGISAECVRFSKDGQSVAYVSYPEGILWKANRDGSNPIQLSDSPIYAFQPRWSPDGTQIVFDDANADGEIYIVSTQSGIPRKLLPEGSGKQSDPDWSPDGHKVVFGSSFGAHDPKGLISVFDLESQKITILPRSAGMTDPRWSPDGRFIAADSFDLHTLNIFDVGMQRWSALHLKVEMDFPEWSGDSQFLYFQWQWGDDRGIYRIRAKGGEVEKVVDLKNWHLAGWSGWTTLDPTDAPLVLRDTGSTYIYALTLEQK
jgi:Tol biopolymer transport system component/DNA-binding winged helix-turn-helix (wHTH) protein